MNKRIEKAGLLSFLFLLLLLHTPCVSAVRNLQFASPLQSLTICDPELKEVPDGGAASSTAEEAAAEGVTQRSRFLSRFRAGLAAETKAKKEIADRRKKQLRADAVSPADENNWADRAKATEQRRKNSEEKFIESAFDQAQAEFDAETSKARKKRKKNPNKYQFVGVIGSSPNAKTAAAAGEDATAITWYARPKPANSNWSLRLVHVNRDAIIKDLFDRNKVDIFAKYENKGPMMKSNSNNNNNSKQDGESDESSSKNPYQPLVTSQYSVKPRSWRNLWNLSPKRFFTDSSGMYWRERRLKPGLYTDGNTVYEATYRYRDGRNGMHRLSPLRTYLDSPAVDPKQKERILKKLAADAPDVVLEE